jgi:uncharacterized protein
MSLEPHQIAIICLELALVLFGAAIWLRSAFVAELRTNLFLTNRIPHWNIAGLEVVALFATMLFCGLIGAMAMLRLAQSSGPTDREGMMVIYNGIGFHGFALLGWPVFHAMRRSVAAGISDPAGGISSPLPRRQSWFHVLRSAVVTLALALPVVGATSVIWTFVLTQFGIAPEPQDLLGIFGRVESPYVLAGMFAVACVLAPLNEELMFRGVMFRFLRQRFGRAPALLVPAAIFGALHGNVGGFLPLSILGVGFALAYEQTGDLRVPIVAHALFNLNTLGILLAGLAP